MAGLTANSVDTRDPERAEAALAVLFPTVRFDHVDPAVFRARVSAVAGSGFTVVDYGFDAPGGAVAQSEDFTAFHTSGRDYTLSAGRDEIDTRSGFLAPTARMLGRWSAVRALAVSFDPVELGRFARTASGRDDLRLRRTGIQPSDPSALRHWAAVVADLRATVAAAPGMFDEPLIERSAFEQLATAFLHAFPTTWLDTAHESTPVELSVIVRRALDYLHGHAADPITVQDIAAAVPISVRGLQYAFTRELGETPRGVLRRVRLDGARADLLSASAEFTTVREIAIRWGFAHATRFATSYEATFGEAPSETLRR